MVTTIQIDEKQLKILMQEKMRYRTTYRTIIEGYDNLINKFKLRKEFDEIMSNIVKKKKNG
jgi:hypothetical protein